MVQFISDFIGIPVNTFKIKSANELYQIPQSRNTKKHQKSTIKEMLKCTNELPAHMTTALDFKIIGIFYPPPPKKKVFEIKIEKKKYPSVK